MDVKTKKRFEDLFSAELILRRVYLHLRQREHPDPHAAFAVAVRHQEIIDERQQLQKGTKWGTKSRLKTCV